MGFTLSFMSYYFYRKYYEQKYLTSESFFKLTKNIPINGNNQFYKQRNVNVNTPALYDYFYRMPQKEFDILFRMKPAFLNGYFDHKKEILFPEKNNGVDGYRIFTPFYFFRFDWSLDEVQGENKKSVKKQDRGGLAVDRGW